jgi:hypothetical protein
VIFGAQELAAGGVAIKPLRDAQAQQVVQALADIDRWAASLRAS